MAGKTCAICGKCRIRKIILQKHLQKNSKNDIIMAYFDKNERENEFLKSLSCKKGILR